MAKPADVRKKFDRMGWHPSGQRFDKEMATAKKREKKELEAMTMDKEPPPNNPAVDKFFDDCLDCCCETCEDSCCGDIISKMTDICMEVCGFVCCCGCCTVCCSSNSDYA